MADQLTTLRAALSAMQAAHITGGQSAIDRSITDLYALIASMEAQPTEAERDAEIERLKDKAATVGYWFSAYGRATEEIDTLRAAAQQGLDALSMHCDRWNAQQSKIVNAAIAALTAALDRK